MALWFDRLRTGKFWASAGQVADPTDEQANQGWSYVQDGKPSVEEFNSRDQWKDRADYWFFQQIAGVIKRFTGGDPTETDPNQLANALQIYGSAAPTIFQTPGNYDYITPNNYGRFLVACVGGGGGSTKVDTGVKTGAGGGAGGTALGLYTIAYTTRVPVTVGGGGSAGGSGANVWNGTSGGTSSFGSYCSAVGGGPGFYDNLESLAGGIGGDATGGFLNVRGGDGSDGHTTLEFPTGYGGSSLFGTSRRAGAPKNGVLFGGAWTPGGGGAPPWRPYNEGASAGGTGAAGMVLILPVA